MALGANTTEVITKLGVARGHILESGIIQFLGLRYAEPPVGELRFAPPVPIQTWGPEPVDASIPGPTPVQSELELEPDWPAVGEDCLWLNVWTPSLHDEPLPVMVWIHGGGFLAETANDPQYFGAELADRGNVVVVCIEYRTNAFGFCHLEDVPGSGNAGLLDQLEALRWVERHVAHFGGDPDRVTIFGESAGGMSVSALMGMEEARGLFGRAIMQSNVASVLRQPDFANAVTYAIKERASTDVGRPIVSTDDLRSLSAAELMDATFAAAIFRTSGEMAFMPVLDGHVFSEPPMQSTAAGLNLHMPILLGTNRDEFRYWATFLPQLSDPEAPARSIINSAMRRALPEGRTIEDVLEFARRRLSADIAPLFVGMAVVDDVMFHMPVLRQAEQHRGPVYLYRFEWEPTVPEMPDFDMGSPHAAELGYVLGNFEDYPEMYGGEWSTGLAHQMMDAWLAFAKTGSPNHDSLPKWPAYNQPSRPTMVFDADGDIATSRVELDIDAERRAFWEGTAFDGTNPTLIAEDF